ncbi:MAG TPA: hypothetical protein VM470_03800 [Acidimicrobiia bacterium]|nr:hypothetical protein [Acidimicrobiia bacterium]
MNDDNLRNRLAASNPSPPSVPVDPITSDRARALMEEVMSIATTEPRAPQRSTRMLTAVAAAFIVVISGAALVGTLNAPGEPLVLTGGGSDPTASCLPFDVDSLADMSPAFGGTVVELTDSVATLEVDRWYTGGEAELVEIEYTPGFEALIGTPAMEVGQRYLITATDGVVNGCGFSGVATPEYEAAFAQAFGA